MSNVRIAILLIELLILLILCLFATDYVVLAIVVVCIITQICFSKYLDLEDSDTSCEYLPEEEDYDEEDDDDLDLKKSLTDFQKAREEELFNLLYELSTAQQNLNSVLESKNFKKISEAEKSLYEKVNNILEFFENYSEFGSVIHQSNNKFKS